MDGGVRGWDRALHLVPGILGMECHSGCVMALQFTACRRTATASVTATASATATATPVHCHGTAISMNFLNKPLPSIAVALPCHCTAAACIVLHCHGTALHVRPSGHATTRSAMHWQWQRSEAVQLPLPPPLMDTLGTLLEPIRANYGGGGGRGDHGNE